MIEELIIGSTNPAKINQIKTLESLDTLSTILNPIEHAPTVLKTSTCPKPQAKVTSQSKNNIDLQNVNHVEGFDPNFVPSDLVDISPYVKTSGNMTICLSNPAALALIRMNNEMKKQKLSLVVSSGYRSYYSQKKLHTEYAPIAKTVAYPRVAPAGHSEHQSGLALDVASELAPGRFATSPESTWIDAHGAEYGFVISYPKNKESQTGYMYEPWHLRYVGVENAKLLKEADYTLAYKPTFYTKPFLNNLLNSLKDKFKYQSSRVTEIGG